MASDSTPNDELRPRINQRVREVQQLLFPGSALPAPYMPNVIGTQEQTEQQLRAFDEHAERTPTEIVEVGAGGSAIKYPDWEKAFLALPKNPPVYETRYLLDTYFRVDNVITPPAVTATFTLPNAIPQGKFAFLDEIHIAQLTGAGSTPNGFLTDIGLSQLYAIVTPDGSTFAASYKSGRNIVPGGVQLMLTLNALLANAQYLISIQYAIKTKLEMPETDLANLFGNNPDRKSVIYDEGSEVADVTSQQVREFPGGPYDFAGYEGDN